MAHIDPSPLPRWLSGNTAVFLILLAFFLFVSKSLYNYPVGIMAALGLYACVRSPKMLFNNPHLRLLIVLFLSLWLPMVLALTDAVSFQHSMHTVAPYIRFLFLGVYVITALANPVTQKTVLLGLFCLVAFWCIDAIVQVLLGIDFFGFPYEERHITGMFYPKNTIAHICAGLSPLYFDLLRQHYKQNKPALLLLVPLFAVILLSGRRAAWIMLALSSAGYVTYFLLTKGYIRIKQLVYLCLVLSVLVGSIIASHDATKRRVVTTLGIFSGNYEEINRATANRLPLWQTSVQIAREHWINGVGPRGYRHVYSSYAQESDMWKESGQTHPHQLVLEVLTETGSLGIAGLFCFFFYFYRAVRLDGPGPSVFPWALSVVIVVFPVNTHMAFYGSYWSSFFWLLLALCLAALGNSSDKATFPVSE